MTYDYETNKKFIDSTYKFLEKLKDKGIWDKETLVIGLDKGVRPLMYTLKKLSSESNISVPEIRFFDYSTRTRNNFPDSLIDVSKKLQKIVSPLKFKWYKKVLILDDHLFSGESLREAKKIFNSYFSTLKKSPKIYLAALGRHCYSYGANNKFKDIIYLDTEKVNFASEGDRGIEDNSKRYLTNFVNKYSFKIPIPLKNKFARENFVNTRKKLSSDIKQYLHEEHPELIKEKDSLEKRVISGFFIASFLFGLIISLPKITGNIIGISQSTFGFQGVILLIIGMVGFLFNNKYKKEYKPLSLISYDGTKRPRKTNN